MSSSKVKKNTPSRHHDEYRNHGVDSNEAAEDHKEDGLPYPEVAGNQRSRRGVLKTDPNTIYAHVSSPHEESQMKVSKENYSDAAMQDIIRAVSSNDESFTEGGVTNGGVQDNHTNCSSSLSTSASNNSNSNSNSTRTSNDHYDEDNDEGDDNSSSLPYPEATKRNQPYTIHEKTKSTSSQQSSTSSSVNNNNTSLPYEDAGLPVRKPKESDSSKRKSKSRGKLGSKLKGKLSKLRKKRDSKYHQILLEDEESGGRTSTSTTTTMTRSMTKSTSTRPNKKNGQEAQPLTSNGNSLPNLGPSRKRENPFSAIKKMYCGEDDTSDDMSSNSVCYMLILFFLLSILLISIGELSSFHMHQQRPSYPPEPTRPPALIHDHDNDPSGHGDFTIHQWQVHQNLALISSQDIDTPGTSQYKAAQWILYVDQMGYGAESPFLFQRFILAMFYYMMEDGYQCFKLIAGIDECNWDRISCDDKGIVQSISFENCRISGQIPVEMPWGFEKIKSIDLSNNSLSGNIPPELELLTKLESLYLERNEKLEGEVPSLLCKNKEKGSLINFTVQCTGESSKVDCSCCDHCNGKSHGGIPVGGVGDDQNIDVELNSRQQAVLSKLKIISGNLITQLGTPQNRAAYWIIQEDKGQYPAESEFLYQRYVLALLHFMIEGKSLLILEQKTRIDECNWDGIACNPNGHVIAIRFERKSVTGHIPMELKVLHDLTYLDLSSNKLSGEIPTGFSLLDKLETLLLDGNDLKGVVPEQICARHDLGLLVHIKTDCNEGGAIQCRCCENCSKFDRWDSNQKATWNKLKTISGDQLLDVNSPQYKAAHWIIEDDKWHYPSNSPFVFQRYVLIILYEMMGEESWFKPDPHSDECKWARVGCNHAGFIEHIELDGCYMEGKIPAELQELEDLIYLDLSSNKLTGHVPPELSKLTKLETIVLDSNAIDGHIPESLCARYASGDLQSLKVDCGRGFIVECKCCLCSNTQNSGSETSNSEWDYNQKATWSALSTLSGSKLSDKTSPQYKAAQWIIDEDKWHYLSSSSFLYQRYVLVLMYNMMGDQTQFKPDVDQDECKWERVGCNHEGYVEHIKFDDCGMNGEIPQEMKVFHDLKYLDLSHNNLSGSIPSELGLLMLLEILMLDSNEFSGAVPDAVCTLHNEHALSQISTDCKANDLKVNCSCCFNCPNSKLNTSSVCKMENLFDMNSVDDTSRAQLIKEKCNEISGDTMCQHNSPQNLAMRWLVEDDKWKLNANSSNFVQRYVIAIIYFSLGPTAWVESFWLDPNQDECLISGISCDSERTIKSLDFHDCGMEGVLPPEIAELDELLEINLSDNEIDGGVPSSWSRLEQLELLDLTYNDMTGSISQSICDLGGGRLKSLKVDCNDVQCTCCDNCSSSVSGGDPPVDLRVQKIGVKVHSISTQFDSARSLALDWIANKDEQNLSADSELFTQRYVLAVFYFSLDGENWTDDIKSWLTSASFCSWHGVVCYDQSGDIEAINLQSFGLKGQVPYELSHLDKLMVLNLSNNQITGSIPNEFETLSNLSILYLHDNNMSGQLSSNKGVCTLRTAENHKLKDFWVDCDKLDCPSSCCSKC